MSVQVLHPAEDIEVLIKRRKQWEGVRWGVYFEENAGKNEEGLLFEG